MDPMMDSCDGCGAVVNGDFLKSVPGRGLLCSDCLTGTDQSMDEEDDSTENGAIHPGMWVQERDDVMGLDQAVMKVTRIDGDGTVRCEWEGPSGEAMQGGFSAEDLIPANGPQSEQFNRFMDRILTEERRGPIIRTEADSPHRRRQLARQERPLGRIRIGGK